MNKGLAVYADPTAIERAIDRANLAPSTRAQYKKAVRLYLATGNRLDNPEALAEYAHQLRPSSRAFLKAAVRLVTGAAMLEAKSRATPDNVSSVQAALYRLEAMQSAVQVSQPKGSKVHTWLSRAQVRALMATCGDGIEGQRDWIVLALLVGAGLRREELVSVRFADILELPNGKNGHTRAVLQVRGKGAKDRSIPIKRILADRLKAWHDTVGGGLAARSLGRRREIGESLSAIGVFNIVRKHGEMIEIPELDPHDLRRTYAQLGYDAGIPITQISKLLGHSTVATTQRYLCLDLDLETTASDFIPLE